MFITRFVNNILLSVIVSLQTLHGYKNIMVQEGEVVREGEWRHKKEKVCEG